VKIPDTNWAVGTQSARHTEKSISATMVHLDFG